MRATALVAMCLATNACLANLDSDETVPDPGARAPAASGRALELRDIDLDAGVGPASDDKPTEPAPNDPDDDEPECPACQDALRPPIVISGTIKPPKWPVDVTGADAGR